VSLDVVRHEVWWRAGRTGAARASATTEQDQGARQTHGKHRNKQR
jgi:hypothetical protein